MDKSGLKHTTKDRLHTHNPQIQKHSETSANSRRMAGKHGTTKTTQGSANANMPQTNEKLQNTPTRNRNKYPIWPKKK